MMQESERTNGNEANLRDGSRPMLLPLVDIPRQRRFAITYNYYKKKTLKQEKFSSLNILAEAAELFIKKENQSFVKEVHLESDLVQMDNAHKQQKSMANLLLCSYRSWWSPFDILVVAAETYEMEENKRSLSLRNWLPFVSIPKKRRSSVQKARAEVVQRMGFQGKRVITHKRCCNSEEPLEGVKVQHLKKRKLESENPPPDLPLVFKNRIRELKGSDVKFIMQKTLYNTDVNMKNSRLSIPQSQIHCDFLSESEKTILSEREDDCGRPCGIEVVVLDPCLREFNLSLKKWGMRGVSVYNLVKNWKRVINENDLQRGDHVELWSFRANGNLMLVLNCRR